MAEFDITTEICLGYHCCGSGEYTEGVGTIELSDEQVNQLVSIIKANDGETDIKTLGLKEKHPDIYEALDEAFSEMTREAEYRYWVLNGYDNGYYEEPDDFVESFENEGLFKYEPDLDALREELGLEEDEEIDEDDLEDAKREAFDEWLEGYVNSLDEDEKVAFIIDHYGSSVVDTDGLGEDYEIAIPQEIVDMAAMEK